MANAQHGFFLEDIQVGQSAEVAKRFTQEDVEGFANISGDNNPLHLDPEFAATTRFGSPIIHGMLTTSLWSTIVGTLLPGPGCAYMSQSLTFFKPVRVGDRVEAKLTVHEIDHDKQRVTLNSEAYVDGVLVAQGIAKTWVPKRSLQDK